jgi:hypothetical protein
MNQILQGTQAILPVKKQELVAYLYDTFDSKPGEPLKLTRTIFTGRFITSLRKYSDVPISSPVPEGWIPVVVEFPKSDHFTAERHFNYFTLERTKQINDFIQASFDLFFYVYFFDLSSAGKIKGEEYEDIEFTKLNLVDSFVCGLNLIDIGSANETIKKREYRRELEILYKKRERFIKKEHRFRKKIYEKRKKYIKNILNQ